MPPKKSKKTKDEELQKIADTIKVKQGISLTLEEVAKFVKKKHSRYIIDWDKLKNQEDETYVESQQSSKRKRSEKETNSGSGSKPKKQKTSHLKLTLPANLDFSDMVRNISMFLASDILSVFRLMLATKSWYAVLKDYHRLWKTTFYHSLSDSICFDTKKLAQDSAKASPSSSSATVDYFSMCRSILKANHEAFGAPDVSSAKIINLQYTFYSEAKRVPEIYYPDICNRDHYFLVYPESGWIQCFEVTKGLYGRPVTCWNTSQMFKLSGICMALLRSDEFGYGFEVVRLDNMARVFKWDRDTPIVSIEFTFKDNYIVARVSTHAEKHILLVLDIADPSTPLKHEIPLELSCGRCDIFKLYSEPLGQMEYYTSIFSTKHVRVYNLSTMTLLHEISYSDWKDDCIVERHMLELKGTSLNIIDLLKGKRKEVKDKNLTNWLRADSSVQLQSVEGSMATVVIDGSFFVYNLLQNKAVAHMAEDSSSIQYCDERLMVIQNNQGVQVWKKAKPSAKPVANASRRKTRNSMAVVEYFDEQTAYQLLKQVSFKEDCVAVIVDTNLIICAAEDMYIVNLQKNADFDDGELVWFCPHNHAKKSAPGIITKVVKADLEGSGALKYHVRPLHEKSKSTSTSLFTIPKGISKTMLDGSEKLQPFARYLTFVFQQLPYYNQETQISNCVIDAMSSHDNRKPVSEDARKLFLQHFDV